jgi:hypothetical protein
MCFRKQGSGRPRTQQEKLPMIRLREVMETEKPAMLVKEICSKAARIYIRCIFLIIWTNSVCQCEGLIRKDSKKIDGKSPIVIQVSAESDLEDDWGSENF